MVRDVEKYLGLFKRFYRQNALRKCFEESSNCSGAVIRSHSIQNSFVLDQLAIKGHVEMLEYENDGNISFKKVSRNAASVFTGYCSHHDNSLFSEIDFNGGSNITRLTERQTVLFFYRSLTKEYWAKLNAVSALTHLREAIQKRDRDKLIDIFPFLSPIDDIDWTFLNQNLFDSALIGQEMGCSDVESLHGSLRTQLQRGKFHQTKSFHLISDLKCSFAVSSLITPVVDFQGNSLNDFMAKKVHFLGVNLFPFGDKTHILLSWHRNSPLGCVSDQIRSIQDNQLRKCLSKFLLAHCENIVFSGDYSSRIGPEMLSNIKKVFYETAVSSSFRLDSLADVDLFD